MSDVENEVRDVPGLPADESVKPRPQSRFDRVLLMATEYFESPLGAIVIVGQDGLVPKAITGSDLRSSGLDAGLVDRIISSRRGVLLEDASSDARHATSDVVAGAPFVRSFLGHPLRLGDEIIGAFTLGSARPRVLGDTDLARLRLVASWIEEELARESELQRAAEVQRALLPRSLPHLDGYEVAASSTPARSVGGDFFDLYETEEGLGLTLADVMGKGIGAALVAATVRAVMRTAAQDSGVVRTVSRASRVLDGDLSDTGSFATLFHARLRRHDGRLHYVDAGHGLTLLVRADGDHLHLAHDDLPLGLAFDHTWHRHTVTLGAGDTLLCFSDGVLDLFDGTINALADVVDVVRYGESLDSVVEFIRSMAERDSNTDDVVVVGIRRVGG